MPDEDGKRPVTTTDQTSGDPQGARLKRIVSLAQQLQRLIDESRSRQPSR